MQAILINELDRVRAELSDHGRTDNFYDSLSASYRKYGSFTERQEAALKRSLTTYHDRNERVVASRKARVITSTIPTGRVTITGKIVSTKWVESQYGDTFKMLVESDQGWRVFGTVPSRLMQSESELLPGTKVAFTAEVTPKETDFGFFSRPTGGAVLKDEHQEPVEAPKPVPAPVVQEQRVKAAETALERAVHFAPIAKDISPADLLPALANVIIANGPDANWSPAKHEARKLSLAAMVAAAGYKA